MSCYSTIYADPPWQYGNGATRNAAAKRYPTLSVHEVCALRVKGVPVATLAAEKAHLYLWTTNAFLQDAFTVIQAWGFEYKSLLVWHKTGSPGLGNYFRVNTEYLMLGVRGGLGFLVHDQPNFMESRRGRHSVKPAAVRRIIARCSPCPYLELFARSKAPGWDTWGNAEHLEQMLF